MPVTTTRRLEESASTPIDVSKRKSRQLDKLWKNSKTGRSLQALQTSRGLFQTRRLTAASNTTTTTVPPVLRIEVANPWNFDENTWLPTPSIGTVIADKYPATGERANDAFYSVRWKGESDGDGDTSELGAKLRARVERRMCRYGEVGWDHAHPEHVETFTPQDPETTNQMFADSAAKAQGN
jgi:hypothetical protein